MNGSTALLIVVVAMAMTSSVTSQWDDACDIVPFEGCTCKNPERPRVACHNLNTSRFPELPDSAVDIDTLDLSQNGIRGMDYRHTMVLKSLRGFNLSQNHLSYWTLEFRPLKDTLEWVDLSYNNIEAVPFEFHHDFKHLKRADLSKNKIEILGHRAFEGLSALEALSLYGNPIKTINKFAWYTGPLVNEGRSPLVHLMLSVTKDLAVTDISTRYLDSLEIISVSGAAKANILEVIKWLKGLPALKQLQLKGIGFYDLPIREVDLEGVEKLERLSLQDNGLKQIWPDFFLHFTNLKSLDLSRNDITSLRPGETLPSGLVRLNLAHNSIALIDTDEIRTYKDLKHLDLRGNKLQALDWSVKDVDSLGDQFIMALGGNPWACICQNKWLKDLISRHTTQGMTHLDDNEVLNTIRCGTLSSEAYVNKLVKDVPESEFACDEGKRHAHRMKLVSSQLRELGIFNALRRNV